MTDLLANIDILLLLTIVLVCISVQLKNTNNISLASSEIYELNQILISISIIIVYRTLILYVRNNF